MKSGINLNLQRRDCNIKELEISIAVFFTMQGLIMWVITLLDHNTCEKGFAR